MRPYLWAEQATTFELISFENSESYTSYKMIFPDIKGPGANSMQLAEVEFYGSSLQFKIIQIIPLNGAF